MKNTMKKILFFLTAVMLFVAVVQTASAAETVDSGTCGENLTWTLDSEGTLSIFGTGDMYDYTDMDNVPWAFYRDLIKTVTIENGVTSIGGLAFGACYSLINVTIPDGVTRIGAGAFCECKNIDKILLPESLKHISYDAFKLCASLKSILIPKNVETIEMLALACAGVDFEEIIIDPENQYFTSVDGVLYDKDVSHLITYPSGKKDTVFDMPDTVISTAAMACCSAYYLETLILSDNLNDLGWCTFEYCPALENIKFGKGLTTLGGWDFYMCTALESVIIPDSIIALTGRVFDGCSALADVTILNPECEIAQNDPDFTNYIFPKTAVVHGFEESTSQTFCELEEQTFHTVVYADNEKEATCFSEGYSGDIYCAVCDKLIPVGEIIAKTEHTLGEWVVTKTAEGYSDGLEERSCLFCDYSETRIIQAIETSNIVTDTQSGVQIEYTDEAYAQDISLQVDEVSDGSYYLTNQYEKILTWNIKTYIGGEQTQPAVPVLVRLPLPADYNTSAVAVYHINSQTGECERIQPVTIEDRYVCFTASSFSLYILVDESRVITTPDPEEPTVPDEPDVSDEPEDPANDCDHLCHKSGILGFFWKIIRVFQKLFGMNPVCECGVAHY